MSQLKLSGDASGTGIVTVAAPNTNNPYTVTLPAAAGTLVNDTGGQTVQFALGSASAPSVTFTGDTNTGVFSSGADTVNFATGGTERMRIDSAGLVGIGTTTPNTFSFNNLVVASGSANAGMAIYGTGQTTFAFATGTSGGNSFRGYIQYTGGGTDTMAFGTAANERMRISSVGGFSVGTTADPGAGAIYATGAITAFYSDRRLKDVKGTIVNALDKVSSLSGVYYTNNEVAVAHGYTSAETQVGLLAQDVEAVLPEIVKAAPFDLDEKGNSKSGEHYKTIQYERVIPLLVEAIKELRAEVQALRG